MWTSDATPLSLSSQARWIMYNNNDVPEHQESHFTDNEDAEDSGDNDDNNNAYHLAAPVTTVCLCFVLPTVY